MEVSSGYEKDVYHSAFGFQSIKLTQDTLQTSYYQASNAYGVSRNVESKSNVRTALLFAQGQIPKEYQASYDLLSVPMTSESARAFKANPIRIVIADLRMPTVNYENFNTKATIDYPYASSLGSYGFFVDVKCIVFMSGAQEILRVNMNS